MLNYFISIINPIINFEDALPGMPIENESNPIQVELSPSIQLGEYSFVLTIISNENADIRYEDNFSFSLLVEEDNQIIYGDLNGDSTINILDIVMIANYTLGQEVFTAEQTLAADINQDGIINIMDIIHIINIILES